MAYARYTYDALRQRIFFTEFVSFHNQTFRMSAILLYREVKDTWTTGQQDSRLHIRQSAHRAILSYRV